MPGKQAKKKRILLIGWDGADWQHITPMLDEGLLPGLESLINRGVMGNLATLQPVLSPMLWNSIATGKTADKHGIHGFVEPLPGNSGVRPSTSTSRKTKAIWNIFNQVGMRSNVIGWWASFPAEPINGHVVTNLFNAIRRNQDGEVKVGPHVIWPDHEAQRLAELKVDINEITEDDIGPFCPNYSKVDQNEDRRLATLAKLVSDCASIQSVTTSLLEKDDWDFTAVYFDSIDHFCHAFMPFHPPRMPNVSERDFEIYKDVIQGAYRFSDMILQRLIQLAGPDATILLCSDHGFQSGRGRPLVTPMEPAGPALWHRSHGIFLLAGPDIRKDTRIYGANIIDITPTLLHAAGLPVGKDMDGRVLLEAFEDDTPAKMIDSWDDVEGDSGMHPPGFDVFDPQESEGKQDELVKQFVALGYIEDPGDDRQQAAENAAIELGYNLARVFYSTNRFSEALPAFVDLVRQSPWEDRFWKNLAYCCYELRHYRQARQIIEGLYGDTELIPPFSKLILAQCAWEHGEKEKATGYVDELLAGNMRVANVYGSLGQLLVSGFRDLSKAERAFELCMAVDPDYPHAYEGLAGIYIRTGRYEQAVDAALQAVSLMHRLPKAHFFLALGLEKLGDSDNAVIALQRVINFNNRKYKLLAYKRLIKIHDSTGMHSRAEQVRQELKILRQQSFRRSTSNKEALLDLPPIPSSEERKRIAESRRKKKNPSAVDSSGKTFLLVSGLPRSGTSLMMQMLQAGGLQLQTDEMRQPDENNPRGYYEWEAIKTVAQNPQILDEEGVDLKAIKVISILLGSLPSSHKYKVIFMMRPIIQIAASQSKMIARLESGGADLAQEQLTERLENHRKNVLSMLETNHQFEFLLVDYESLVTNPENQIRQVSEFVDSNVLRAEDMPGAIRSELHRERQSDEQFDAS